MKESYYHKNKHNWKKGGKYYKYKPRLYIRSLIVKRQKFILYFD